jgi:hypothetical protein
MDLPLINFKISTSVLGFRRWALGVRKALSKRKFYALGFEL